MGKIRITVDIINAKKPKDCRLTAIRRLTERTGDGKLLILFKCLCGKTTKTIPSPVISGRIKSCGCLIRDSAGSRHLSILEINKKLTERESQITAVSFSRTLRDKSGTSHRRIKCYCKCGRTFVKTVELVLSKGVKSCGCLPKSPVKYWPKIKAIQMAWHGMIDRCYNANSINYKSYGGRGVRVCKEWREDYQKFLDWSIANGWKPKLQIDKDIKGNGLLYSPNNCLWVSAFENSTHTRATIRHKFNGKQLTLAEISAIVGIKKKLLYARMYKKNCSLSAALAMGVPKLKKGSST